jgi:hypothetical protein
MEQASKQCNLVSYENTDLQELREAANKGYVCQPCDMGVEPCPVSVGAGGGGGDDVDGTSGSYAVAFAVLALWL